MNKAIVVNLKTYTGTDAIRIDRATPFGNPYMIGRDGTREQVCRKHKKWLLQWVWHKKEIVIRGFSNKWVVEHLHELRGRKIACHCAPLLCHGYTLRDLANE